jgi:hypothetical protein
MDINDFSMLTQDEVNEVVAEVLEEAGIRTEADRNRDGVDDETGERDPADDSDAADNAAIQGDVSPDPAAKFNAKTAAGSAKTKEAGAGLKSAMSNAAQQGNIATPGTPDKKLGLGQKRADADRMGNPDSDQDAGQKDVDPDSEQIGSLGSAWFTPGSSNLPKSAIARINSTFPDDARMSPTEVVTAYVRAGHGSDVTSLMAKEEYKMTLARLGRYVQKAQQSKDENDAMKVRRVLDSLLDMSIRFRGQKGQEPKDDQETTPPEEATPPEDGGEQGDDKEFVTNQDRGPMTYMLAMHKQSDYAGASVEQVKGLAQAVSKDLALNERRQPKELENTLKYLKDIDTPSTEGAFEALKKLLTGFLKTTKFALGPETAKQLGFGGKRKDPAKDEEPNKEEPTKVDVEEVPDEEEAEESGDEEEKANVKYTLPNSFRSRLEGSMQQVYSELEQVHAKQYPEKDFKRDLIELVRLLGPHNPMITVRKLDESNKLGRVLKMVAKINGGGERNSEETFKSLGALKSADKNGAAYRIINAMLRYRGRKGGQRQVGNDLSQFVGALMNAAQAVDISGKKPKEKAEEPVPDNVIDLDSARAQRADDTDKKVAAEGVLSESVVNRWKTISGVKKDD